MPEMDFGALAAFWNSLTAKQRQEMVDALNQFHALRGSLQNRGLIECDSGLTQIKIFKKTAETSLLVRLLKKTGAQGIKVEYKLKRNGA